ncbi:hypothetical protein EOD42_16700 [Rhodovarius crocodyli]|uniref:Uncharacterized protein n=1 Tax=Rhodovarius crocodyli TaxID=1979269 RepID=A0A437MC51_9PROT|nr:hypothetical protein [Rhodovarius crocodyli]RVT95224.1 hypothetical protein EOD42_16700 [Rhodovarius crocodyli]
MTAATASPGDRVMEALRRLYGPLRHAEKLLGRRANSTPRAARNWLDDNCAMSVDKLVELMAADPKFHAAVNEVVSTRRAERSP